MKLERCCRYILALFGGGLYTFLIGMGQSLSLLAWCIGIAFSFFLFEMNAIYAPTLPLFHRVMAASVVLTGAWALLELLIVRWLDLAIYCPPIQTPFVGCFILSSVLLPADSWLSFFLFGKDRPNYPLL